MKKKKSKTKTIVKKEDQKLLWLGAQRLMIKPKNETEKREQNIILMAARVLKVSPFGINILGGQPYINKLGLVQKAQEYLKNVKFEYGWVRFAEDDEGKAICKCRVLDGNKKPLCDWIVGECSLTTMSMKTLKGYQNHMAQTRARNRAILETFGNRIHKEMMMEVEKLYRKAGAKEILDITAPVVSTSVEEMPAERPIKRTSVRRESKVTGLNAGKKEKENIKEYAVKLGAKTEAEIPSFIKKTIGISVDFNTMTKVQASKVMFDLLEKLNKHKG